MKTNKSKILHLTIIILGIIFLALPVFHTNLWFDESYSVALAEHNFIDIWEIGGNDVHPILYYMILHILNIISGNNIMILRMFSWICISLVGILGYTHIRKDFGEKTGIIFSFLALFLPVSGLYSGEIRMYSLGLLLGTLTAIYAYRIYKNNINKATFIIFLLSSLALAYTHYYGLMLAGIVNLILFIYLIKNYKERKKDLIKFIISAAVQVVAYIPWLVNFVIQLKGVSSGFWITLVFPDTLYEILTMQYKGNLEMIPAVIITLAFYIYIIYRYIVLKKNKEDLKACSWCFIIYLAIIIIALLISLCMHSVILLYRYLLIITGLLIFAISDIMAKNKKIYLSIIICICVLLISVYSMCLNIKEVYNKNNNDCIDYIKENIETTDIIVYSNAINGAVISTKLSSDNNISYFYNKDNWGIYEAYKAYLPYMEVKDTLEEILDSYEGRIWLIERENTSDLYNEISSKYDVEKLENKSFKSEYKNYSYTVELIKK